MVKKCMLKKCMRLGGVHTIHDDWSIIHHETEVTDMTVVPTLYRCLPMLCSYTVGCVLILASFSGPLFTDTPFMQLNKHGNKAVQYLVSDHQLLL